MEITVRDQAGLRRFDPGCARHKGGAKAQCNAGNNKPYADHGGNGAHRYDRQHHRDQAQNQQQDTGQSDLLGEHPDQPEGSAIH